MSIGNMRAEEKQAVEFMLVPPKINNANHHVTIKYHEQFQRTHERLCRKISDEPEHSEKEDRCLTSSSLHLLDAISTENISTTSNEAQNKSDTWKSDARKSLVLSGDKTTQQLEWKYKNPYSVSICDRTRYESSDNILNEDEPQEGKTKRSILFDCREYLANYQETCGTPRNEYSFAALIIVMIQATARSLWALLYVFANVASVIQMFTFILRFILDKVISIRRTKELRQAIVKFVILAVQLLSVYVCLMFIFGIIVLPIVQMAIGIAAKLMTHG